MFLITTICGITIFVCFFVCCCCLRDRPHKHNKLRLSPEFYPDNKTDSLRSVQRKELAPSPSLSPSVIEGDFSRPIAPSDFKERVNELWFTRVTNRSPLRSPVPHPLRPVALTLLLAPLHQLSHHHEVSHFILPQHEPEIVHRVLLGSLRADEPLGDQDAWNVGCVDVPCPLAPPWFLSAPRGTCRKGGCSCTCSWRFLPGEQLSRLDTSSQLPQGSCTPQSADRTPAPTAHSRAP